MVENIVNGNKTLRGPRQRGKIAKDGYVSSRRHNLLCGIIPQVTLGLVLYGGWTYMEGGAIKNSDISLWGGHGDVSVTTPEEVSEPHSQCLHCGI